MPTFRHKHTEIQLALEEQWCKKKNERTTAVAVAQLFFLENSFQKHKILTSLEAILERFVF